MKKLSREQVLEMYGALDEEDVRFIDTAILMLMTNIADGKSALVILPDQEQESCGMLCYNMESNAIYETLNMMASSIMEDLANAPSPLVQQ